MSATAAVRDIAGIATLIGQIYNAIGNHVIEKETLIMLLKDYEYRLIADQPYLARGLELRHCQPHAMNLYEKLVLLGEWLAAKHIKLRNAQGGLLSRRRWKFPWKFSGKKRVVFQQFLYQVQHASDRLIDCLKLIILQDNVLTALPAAALKLFIMKPLYNSCD
ncbi:hypothetical protein BDV30DRAFT_229430 [Aspergillus minisclerotigenes]|uniref:Uncharacterized protein n=1 Tax=Aspergillus minisclerotigenes TaxID=656917 RepID=A0A5N6ITG8_9EURO|nr:hypothetical protein BDV30DRAFT_229430 [Aspergillus minisclerotigenes]